MKIAAEKNYREGQLNPDYLQKPLGLLKESQIWNKSGRWVSFCPEDKFHPFSLRNGMRMNRWSLFVQLC